MSQALDTNADTDTDTDTDTGTGTGTDPNTDYLSLMRKTEPWTFTNHIIWRAHRVTFRIFFFLPHFKRLTQV